MKVKSGREVAQSCPTLSDPMDCSPPGSPLPGILQARALEWLPSPSLCSLDPWSKLRSGHHFWGCLCPSLRPLGLQEPVCQGTSARASGQQGVHARRDPASDAGAAGLPTLFMLLGWGPSSAAP